jgi:hypothetical protein
VDDRATLGPGTPGLFHHLTPPTEDPRHGHDVEERGRHEAEEVAEVCLTEKGTQHGLANVERVF